MPRFTTQTANPVQVGASLTDVLSYELAGQMGQGLFTINNTGANATTGLAVLCQHVANGPWLPWLSGADFSVATQDYSPSNNPPPNAIPAGGTAYLRLRPGAIEAIKLQATSANGTTVTASFAGQVVN